MKNYLIVIPIGAERNRGIPLFEGFTVERDSSTSVGMTERMDFPQRDSSPPARE
jgi:hypothetical protein